MEIFMKYLLLVIYLFSTVSFANHCNAGASHDGKDRQADTAEMEESASESTESNEEENSTDSENDSDSEV
jgi:hypothetical protein